MEQLTEKSQCELPSRRLRIPLYRSCLPGVQAALGDDGIRLLTSVFLGHMLYSMFRSTTEQSNRNHCASSKQHEYGAHSIHPVWELNLLFQVLTGIMLIPLSSLTIVEGHQVLDFKQQFWASPDNRLPPACWQRNSTVKIAGSQYEQACHFPAESSTRAPHQAVLLNFSELPLTVMIDKRGVGGSLYTQYSQHS